MLTIYVNRGAFENTESRKNYPDAQAYCVRCRGLIGSPVFLPKQISESNPNIEEMLGYEAYRVDVAYIAAIARSVFIDSYAETPVIRLYYSCRAEAEDSLDFIAEAICFVNTQRLDSLPRKFEVKLVYEDRLIKMYEYDAETGLRELRAPAVKVLNGSGVVIGYHMGAQAVAYDIPGDGMTGVNVYSIDDEGLHVDVADYQGRGYGFAWIAGNGNDAGENAVLDDATDVDAGQE